jgi:hypothetical protein
MYREIGEFIKSVGSDKRLWKDGEFWTALVLGVGASVWFFNAPTVIIDIRTHFGDLLSVSSIIFGFVLTTLFFYIQAAATWSNEPRVKKVAELLVNDHVWSVSSQLVLLGYILFLWVFGKPDCWNRWVLAVSYGALAFLLSYCGFQILNHVLTVRWAFLKWQRLQAPNPPSEGKIPAEAGETPPDQKAADPKPVGNHEE